MKSRSASSALLIAAFTTLIKASPTAKLGTSLSPRSTLAKRDIINVACGQYSTADFADTVNKNLLNLNREGEDATVAPRSCGRAGCYNTSGFYICNDMDEQLNVPLTDVVDIGYLIEGYCGNDNIGPFTHFSGQAFVATGYNVVIAYANCNDPTDIPPSSYTPPGPNGDPPIVCGFDGVPPCRTGQGCPAGGLTVESAESIVCNEYLAPTYIGPGATYTYSTTRSIGTTWTAGGFLGFNVGDLSAPLALLGGSFSFSETTTTGDISGISADCGEVDGSNGLPGNWTCGMDIAPKCLHMTGTCATGDPVLGTVPYDVLVPQTDGGDGQSIYTANICTCPNCDGSDEDSAPVDMCRLNCDTCLPS